MIAACLEVERGVENLWKRGESDGFKDFSNYGQFIPINYFRAFIAGFPALWAEEKYWHLDARDMPWDIITPFVGEYNKKRGEILRVVYLMLDEAMSGWPDDLAQVRALDEGLAQAVTAVLWATGELRRALKG